MGGDGNDCAESVPGLVVRRDYRKQRRRLHGIDLVDGQNAGDLLIPDTANQILFRASHMGDWFHQQQGAVHIAEAGGNDLDHIVPQRGFRTVQPRRVHKDELGAVPVQHAVDTVPGGLGLVGDDGDFLPHQRVGQAGFSHVRPSADSNHSSFCNAHSGNPQLSVKQF